MRRSLAIFCELGKGASQEYLKGAVQLGEELVKRKWWYKCWDYREVADTALKDGGKVTVVIPKRVGNFS